MMIREAVPADLPAWAMLRAELWPEASVQHHLEELRALMTDPDADVAAFVAAGESEGIVGFAEASLRRDYVNGCETSPVAFAEGLFVRPHHVGEGVGRALMSRIEMWARSKGCRELASDALITNLASHAFHLAVGFEETERVVFFRKPL